MPTHRDGLVLVVGSSNDPHIQGVLSHVARCGVGSCIVDPTSGPASSSLIYRMSEAGSELQIRTAGGGKLALSSVTAVWWRLKPSVHDPGSDTARQMSDFCTREWRHALEPLEVLLGGAKWVNPRAVDRRVRYKPAQLHLAQEFGFDIPDTLISNDSAAVVEFLKNHGGDGIYKPLTWYFEFPDKILFTNPVNTEFIERNGASVERAPGIFQPLLPKAFELRITVVNERVFPVRINSQALDGAQLDWRRKQLDLAYEPYPLTPSFQERLVAFHRSLGLVYGAYDFIVTPEDKPVFLEVNPSGQWLWIEEHTRCPISEAVAESLI